MWHIPPRQKAARRAWLHSRPKNGTYAIVRHNKNCTQSSGAANKKYKAFPQSTKRAQLFFEGQSWHIYASERAWQTAGHISPAYVCETKIQIIIHTLAQSVKNNWIISALQQYSDWHRRSHCEKRKKDDNSLQQQKECLMFAGERVSKKQF